MPIWLADEQLGFASSALPVLAAAAAMAASEQYGMPASLPVSPFGRVTLTTFSSCSPSARAMWTRNGLYAPALVLSDFAE